MSLPVAVVSSSSARSSLRQSSSALVSSPWPRFGIAAGLTAIAWVLSDDDVIFAAGERPVLAGAAGAGHAARSRGGCAGAARCRGRCDVPGASSRVSPRPRGSRGVHPRGGRGAAVLGGDRRPGGPDDPRAAAGRRHLARGRRPVRGPVDWLRRSSRSARSRTPRPLHPSSGEGSSTSCASTGSRSTRTAPQIYPGWIWLAVTLAVTFVVAAAALRRRRTKAS